MGLLKEEEEDNMFSNFSQQPTVATTEIQERLTLEEAWPMLAILGVGLLVASRNGKGPLEKPKKKKKGRR